MMDVIKMEHEIDPLAIERRNNTDIEEQKPLSEERNVLDLQVTGIKTECMDHSYDVKTEMTFDETPVPVHFVVVKSELKCDYYCLTSSHFVNYVSLHYKYRYTIELKIDCMDKSYDLKSEMTFDETSVPIDCSIVKSQVEVVQFMKCVGR
ncbi:hypothetical protein ANN_27894 [Periplaneta americana]|uniref:SipL SPOCS domain-containing protein n=1 Tax=Periplaneta americana TaxID=6978 RepID=A0ABQ8RVF5_PERAM|nr:hypothetical protein ANN_27894 [Periplaneta americana]